MTADNKAIKTFAELIESFKNYTDEDTSDYYKEREMKVEKFRMDKKTKYSLSKLSLPCKTCLVVSMCSGNGQTECDLLKKELKRIIKNIKKEKK